MVVSPKQAVELTEDERILVSDLERKIDEKILTDFWDGKTDSYYQLPPGINSRTRKYLLKRYAEVEWYINFLSDNVLRVEATSEF